MNVENRVKGVTLFILSFIYFSVFTFESFHLSFSQYVSTGYYFLMFSTFIFAVFITRSLQKLRWYQEFIANTLLFSLAIFLLFLTNHAESVYFPILLFAPMVYSALTKTSSLFFFANGVGFSILFYYIYIDHFFAFHLKGSRIILELILYFSIVFVVRNYQSDCLTCTLEQNSCPNQDTCSIYQTAWKKKGDQIDPSHSKS